MFRAVPRRLMATTTSKSSASVKRSPQASRVMDDRMQYKWFILVAAFGTMVYVNVVNRIQDQDHSSNLEKYKKNFTPEEWEDYISQIERKSMLLDNNEQCYLIPFPNKQSVSPIVKKLGGDDNVRVIDLNALVKHQLDTPSAKYHIVLKDNFESQSNKEDGFQFKFTYKLRPGLFTQLVNDSIKAAKDESPSIGRFLILNYPPTIKEAVKFEQNISTNDIIIKMDKSNNSDIIQYFETVDKTVLVSDLKQMNPFKVQEKSSLKKQQKPPVLSTTTPKHICLADIVPDESSSAIHRAQYKLRLLGEPIRKYGESNDDIIKRLSSLNK